MTMNYLHTKKGGTISSLNHHSIDYNGIARNFIARYISFFSFFLFLSFIDTYLMLLPWKMLGIV